jgi:hypothetical protein
MHAWRRRLQVREFDFTPEHGRDEESSILLLLLTVPIVVRRPSRAPRRKQERTIERWKTRHPSFPLTEGLNYPG